MDGDRVHLQGEAEFFVDDPLGGLELYIVRRGSDIPRLEMWKFMEGLPYLIHITGPSITDHNIKLSE